MTPPSVTPKWTAATSQSWDRAIKLFEDVSKTDPNSGWASAALISRLRLHWLLGRPQPALEALAALKKKGSADNFARALLFLAVSDLAQGQVGSAGNRLSEADKTGRLADYEVAYWQGRQAEIEGRPKDAVDAYLTTLAEDPFHPFGEAASERLKSESLRDHALESAEWLAAGPNIESLYKAWLLFGDSDPRGKASRRALVHRLNNDLKTRPFLSMSTVPVTDWPLWKAQLDTPEELLMGLGLFGETSTPVLRHFPIAEPSLAFTGSRVLAHNGSTRRSLYIAEILRKRIPTRLPTELLSSTYHELLYPFRYSYLILRESSKPKN